MKEFPVSSVVSLLAERVLCSDEEFNELLFFLCGIENLHDSAYQAAVEYASKVLLLQKAKFPWILKIDTDPYDIQKNRILITHLEPYGGTSPNAEVTAKVRAELLALNAAFCSQIEKIAKTNKVVLESSPELKLLPFDKSYVSAWWHRYYSGTK